MDIRNENLNSDYKEEKEKEKQERRDIKEKNHEKREKEIALYEIIFGDCSDDEKSYAREKLIELQLEYPMIKSLINKYERINNASKGVVKNYVRWAINERIDKEWDPHKGKSFGSYYFLSPSYKGFKEDVRKNLVAEKMEGFNDEKAKYTYAKNYLDYMRELEKSYSTQEAESMDLDPEIEDKIIKKLRWGEDKTKYNQVLSIKEELEKKKHAKSFEEDIGNEEEGDKKHTLKDIYSEDEEWDDPELFKKWEADQREEKNREIEHILAKADLSEEEYCWAEANYKLMFYSSTEEEFDFSNYNDEEKKAELENLTAVYKDGCSSGVADEARIKLTVAANRYHEIPFKDYDEVCMYEILSWNRGILSIQEFVDDVRIYFANGGGSLYIQSHEGERNSLAEEISKVLDDINSSEKGEIYLTGNKNYTRRLILALGFIYSNVDAKMVNDLLGRVKLERLYPRLLNELTLIFAYNNNLSLDEWTKLNAECESIVSNTEFGSSINPQRDLYVADIEKYISKLKEVTKLVPYDASNYYGGDSISITRYISRRIADINNEKDLIEFVEENKWSFVSLRQRTYRILLESMNNYIQYNPQVLENTGRISFTKLSEELLSYYGSWIENEKKHSVIFYANNENTLRSNLKKVFTKFSYPVNRATFLSLITFLNHSEVDETGLGKKISIINNKLEEAGFSYIENETIDELYFKMMNSKEYERAIIRKQLREYLKTENRLKENMKEKREKGISTHKRLAEFEQGRIDSHTL